MYQYVKTIFMYQYVKNSTGTRVHVCIFSPCASRVVGVVAALLYGTGTKQEGFSGANGKIRTNPNFNITNNSLSYVITQHLRL